MKYYQSCISVTVHVWLVSVIKLVIFNTSAKRKMIKNKTMPFLGTYLGRGTQGQ